MGELHDLFESYGGEEAFIRAMSDPEEAIDLANKIKHEIRRDRIRKNGGKHSPQDVAEIRTKQDDRCVYCGIALKGMGHKDHIMPLSLGGTNGKENLQLTCAPCNLIKGSAHPNQLFDDIKLLHFARFCISEETIKANTILNRIGVEGVRYALMRRWELDYHQALSENVKWRTKLKRGLKKLYPTPTT